MISKLIRKRFIEHKSWKESKLLITRCLVVLFTPMVLSLIIYGSFQEEKKPYEVVIIQPNTDPYNEKFNGSTDEQQLLEILDLADKVVTRKTQLVVAPETALYPNYGIDEGELHQLTAFHLLMERRARWNNASFLIGASTQKYFDFKNSRASREDVGGPGYFESYNSSILFKENRTPDVIHKSKLVLGVEKIPFSNIFPQLEEMSIEMGGSSGSLGIQDEGPSVLKSRGINFAPVICYESIYGDFVRKQCRQDAAFIAIITNDGWWGDTPGYKQHFAFARLRAIENRKYVIRSANTGKSGIINERGDVVKETGWWQELSFHSTIQLSSRKTIYQYLGDYIAYFSTMGLLIFLIMIFLKPLLKRRLKNNPNQYPPI